MVGRETTIENPYGFIYITTNLINGKKYLGQKSFDKGWERYLGSGRCFKAAVEKYGRKNFYRTIVCFCYSLEELNKTEYDLSVFLDVVEDRDWYNLCYGGSGSPGYILSEEEKHQRSVKSKEVWSREGFKDKMIKIHTGSKHRPRTEEQKRFLSERLKGVNKGKKNPQCRAIYCPELNEFFYSQIEAQEKYNIPPGGISCCCNGHQNTAGKHPVTGEPLTWEYVDKSHIERNKRNNTHKTGLDCWNIRAVNQYSLSGCLLRRWDYISQAGEKCGIDPSSIRKCCSGAYQTAGGFVWRYKDDFDEDFLVVRLPEIKNKGAVVQLDIHNRFICEYLYVAEAAKQNSFDESSINKCCNGKARSYKGFQFIRKRKYEQFIGEFGEDLGGFPVFELLNKQKEINN